jgi:endonuclease YncB( thermonuclease family)
MKQGWFICAMLALMSWASAAAEFRVLDGDSFTMDGETIRLWGIDTPEPGQQCMRNGRPWIPAPEAAAALRALLDQAQDLKCTKRDVDRLGRIVSTCRTQGRDLGHQMVQSGWAWDYFENSGGFYIPPEADARHGNRGVWSGECTVPWRWRRSRR